MAILNLPVWPFEINWSDDVLETLEWLTTVMRSPTGAEQRQCLRRFPRRTFEFEVALKGRDRALFDQLMMTHGARDWYYPLRHDVHLLPNAVGPGTLILPVETALNGEFAAGGILALNDGDPFRHELAEIHSVDTGGIVLVNPLVGSWAQGASLYPVRKARLVEQPEVRRVSDTTITSTLRFKIVEPGTSVGEYSAEMYRGFAVFPNPPEEADSLSYGYERLTVELDNQTGIPLLGDTAGISFPRQQYAWTLHGHDEHLAFRRLLEFLRGRLTAFWMPTFFDDLHLAAPTPVGSALLTVENINFTALGGPRTGRRDICIEMTDGAKFYRRITGSTLAGSDREVIGIDEPFDREMNGSNVLRISFMMLNRLDQDNIEISHVTDAAGVSKVAAAFRGAPDLRRVEAGF